MSTLYATFDRAADAEKAAGALIDHGALRHDLTITSEHSSIARPHDGESKTAAESGENEGWPEKGPAAAAAEQQIVDQSDSQASEHYRRADNAENSAKVGISLTTPADVVTGAIRGGAVGLCLGILGSILWIVPWHMWIAANVPNAIMTALLGLGAGAIVGGVIGLLLDQGVSNSRVSPRPAAQPGRSVLLAVDVSSGSLQIRAARRLVSKYHATRIEVL